MRKRVQASFDPKKFLAKVGDGKTIHVYRKNQIVFSQGEVADAVFYIEPYGIKSDTRKPEIRPRWNDVPRGTMDEVSSYSRLNLQSH